MSGAVVVFFFFFFFIVYFGARVLGVEKFTLLMSEKMGMPGMATGITGTSFSTNPCRWYCSLIGSLGLLMHQVILLGVEISPC